MALRKVSTISAGATGTVTLDIASHSDGGNGVPDTVTVSRTVTGTPGALTYYYATGGPSLAVSAAQLIAGAGGTDTLEFTSAPAAADGVAQNLSGLTSASDGATKMAVVAANADQSVISNVFPFAVSGSLDFTPPAVEGTITTTSATSLTIIATEPVYSAAADGAGFGLTVDGAANAVTGVTGFGTDELVVSFTDAISGGEDLLLSYDSGSGDVVDGDGNALASFSDVSVTNNEGVTLALTHIGNYGLAGAASTSPGVYDFTGISHSSGTLIIGVSVRDSTGTGASVIPSNVTCSGASASVMTDGSQNATRNSPQMSQNAYSVGVSAGTSGVQVVLPGDVPQGVKIEVYLLEGAHTVHDVSTGFANFPSAPHATDVSVNVEDGGVVVALAAGASTTLNWDSLVGVTSDAVTISDGLCVVAASATGLTAATPRTVTIGDADQTGTLVMLSISISPV